MELSTSFFYCLYLWLVDALGNIDVGSCDYPFCFPRNSVPDQDPGPDPLDPKPFGPPRSGSVSQRYGSRSGSFHHQAKIILMVLKITDEKRAGSGSGAGYVSQKTDPWTWIGTKISRIRNTAAESIFAFNDDRNCFKRGSR